MFDFKESMKEKKIDELQEFIVRTKEEQRILQKKIRAAREEKAQKKEI